MPKPIAAIVESVHEQAFADVRARHAEYRELSAQAERATKRRTDAERIENTAIQKRDEKRIEVGRALLRARMAWPERGPKAKGWGEYLRKEGIDDSTALRWMDLARAADGGDFTQAARLSETPHPVNVPDELGPATVASRKPLGLLADMQLYVGRWQDVLSKDEIGMVDTVITDSPYSARTHSGGREAARADGYDEDGLAPEYLHWNEKDVDDFVAGWSPRTRGWMVNLSDHHLIGAWSEAYERHGRYVYAPVPCVIQGMTVRLAGDGPSSWAVYAIVARPRSLAKWGTLPGAYVGGREPGSKNGRGKPRWLMDALVRDYSRRGDLVCDPLAGYGTTLVSALLQYRRAVGAEMDAEVVEEAFRRANEINEQPAAPSDEQPAA